MRILLCVLLTLNGCAKLSGTGSGSARQIDAELLKPSEGTEGVPGYIARAGEISIVTDSNGIPSSIAGGGGAIEKLELPFTQLEVRAFVASNDSLNQALSQATAGTVAVFPGATSLGKAGVASDGTFTIKDIHWPTLSLNDNVVVAVVAKDTEDAPVAFITGNSNSLIIPTVFQKSGEMGIQSGFTPLAIQDEIRGFSASVAFKIASGAGDFWGRLLNNRKKSDLGTATGWFLRREGTRRLAFCIENDKGKFTFMVSSFLLNDNQWYHVTGTFHSTTGTQKLYIDGKLNKTIVNPNLIGANLTSGQKSTIGAALTTIPPRERDPSEEFSLFGKILGGENEGENAFSIDLNANGSEYADQYFYGDIAQYEFHNRVLTESEITAFANTPPTNIENFGARVIDLGFGPFDSTGAF